MRVEKFVNKKNQKLSEAVCDNLRLIGYNHVQKLLRNKDIKINGARINKDISLKEGDVVEVYLAEEKRKIEIVFEDDDLLVAFKPRQIETCKEDEKTGQTSETLENLIESQTNTKLFAVHRLDRNTEGLVIFSKNEESKKSLDNAIKNRGIEKYYLAFVSGKVSPKEAKCKAFLKKDDKKSLVYVSAEKKEGYVPIETDYKLIKHADENALLEVHLVTGKTHQIRAHLAFLGYPIIGDEKYGNAVTNKKFKKRFQCLCAYKLIFKFDKNDYLERLNGKVIELTEKFNEYYKFL